MENIRDVYQYFVLAGITRYETFVTCYCIMRYCSMDSKLFILDVFSTVILASSEFFNNHFPNKLYHYTRSMRTRATKFFYHPMNHNSSGKDVRSEKDWPIRLHSNALCYFFDVRWWRVTLLI